MRRSFLFALVAVVLGTALYTAFFFESAVDVDTSPQAGTSTGLRVENIESTGSAKSVDTVPSVLIGGSTVRVVLADSPEERSKGLSGRSGLREDEGMLFIFPEEGIYGFWMKDMRFSIDIIWLSADGTVVHIAENVSPDSYPASFLPGRAARYVLEVPAGFTKAHNIAVGSAATLPR